MKDLVDFKGSKFPWEPLVLNQECFDECCTNKLSSVLLESEEVLGILTHSNSLSEVCVAYHDGQVMVPPTKSVKDAKKSEELITAGDSIIYLEEVAYDAGQVMVPPTESMKEANKSEDPTTAGVSIISHEEVLDDTGIGLVTVPLTKSVKGGKKDLYMKSFRAGGKKNSYMKLPFRAGGKTILEDRTTARDSSCHEEKSPEGIILLSPLFSRPPSCIKSVFFTQVANLRGSLVLLLLLSSQLLISGEAATPVSLTSNSGYTVRSMAIFYCSAANCVGVQWLLNGTQLDCLNHTDCTSDFSVKTTTGVLIVNPISLEHNESTIQCEARFSSGTALLSDKIVILIQGFLSPVANLTYTLLNSTINLSWNAPFSLDHNIAYCVDIYNSISSSLIQSRCAINNTQYVYTSSPHLLACTEYSVNVTAVNIVGNSTATTLSIMWDGEQNVTDISATSVSNNKSIIRIITLQYLCYTSLSVDVVGMALPSLQYKFIQPNVIELLLNDNTQYTLIIHDRSSHMPFNISTYDVKTVQTEVVNNNTVDLNSTFITNSSAKGVLYILININKEGNVNFPRSVYLCVARDNATEGIKEFNVSQGSYTVLAYDIEEDASLQEHGLPAATTNMILVPGETIDNNQRGGNCDVDNSTGFNINITCYCQEIAYQVVLQRNDGSLDSVKNITTKRSRCSQSVFFEVPIEGTYCATVFHEENGNGIFGTKIYFAKEFEVNHLSTRSPTTDTMSSDHNGSSSSLITVGIVGALFGFFLMCAIVFTLVVSMFCVRKKKKKRKYSTSTTCDNNVYGEQHKFQANRYGTIELGTANDCTEETHAVPSTLYNSSSNDDFLPPKLPTPLNSPADSNIQEQDEIDSAAQTPESPPHYQSVVETLEEIVEEKDVATPVKVKDHTAGVAECGTSDIRNGATLGEILCKNLDNDYFTTNEDENKSNVTQESADITAAQRNVLHGWHEGEEDFRDFYKSVQVFPITFDQDFHHCEPVMCSDSSCSNSVILPGCSSSTISSSFGSYAETSMTFPKCISVPSNEGGIVFYPEVIFCDGDNKENEDLETRQKNRARVIAKKLNYIACSVTTSKYLKCLCDVDLWEFMKNEGSVVLKHVLGWLSDTSNLNAHGDYRRVSAEFYTDPGLLQNLKQEKMKVEKKPCRKKYKS